MCLKCKEVHELRSKLQEKQSVSQRIISNKENNNNNVGKKKKIDKGKERPDTLIIMFGKKIVAYIRREKLNTVTFVLILNLSINGILAGLSHSPSQAVRHLRPIHQGKFYTQFC